MLRRLTDLLLYSIFGLVLLPILPLLYFGEWELFLLLCPIALFPLVFGGKLERRRIERARTKFLTDREPISDDDFLAFASANSDRAAFYRTARQALSRLCDIPAEMIHPSDSMRTLFDLQFDGGYLQDLFFELEDAGYRIDPESVDLRDWESMPVAEFLEKLIECSLTAPSDAAKRGE